jgi:hypothetical protein
MEAGRQRPGAGPVSGGRLCRSAPLVRPGLGEGASLIAVGGFGEARSAGNFELFPLNST